MFTNTAACLDKYAAIKTEKGIEAACTTLADDWYEYTQTDEYQWEKDEALYTIQVLAQMGISI